MAAVDQNMAEDHTCKGGGECHPYREFEGMQPSREMNLSHYQLMDPDMNCSKSKKRVKACGKALPTHD